MVGPTVSRIAEPRDPGFGEEHADDVWVAGVLLGADVRAEVDGLRATVPALGAVQAEQLRRVARIATRCAAAARHQLAASAHVPGQPSEAELVHTVVTMEVMAVLGIGKSTAESLVALAERLVRVLPDTLAALAEGRLDLARVRALAEATVPLSDTDARAVEASVLPTAGAAPWEGPSPRSWRARVERAVVAVDVEAARRRREAAIRGRQVRAWPLGDGTGMFEVVAADVDVAMVDRVLTNLACDRPDVDPATGERLSLDQRRTDAFVDLFRRVESGDELPRVRSCGVREVGLVLHADTFFGDGPAKDAPGEMRGLGAPSPVDPRSAALMAAGDIAGGAGVRVLLVDRDGVLTRTLRLPGRALGLREGEASVSRTDFVAAVRQALHEVPVLETDGYEPTVAIDEHVRTRSTRCTAYDCARCSDRCDLDHTTPWPRGPTSARNLAPRCRRHHVVKTRRLVRVVQHDDGTVSSTSLLGTTVTTAPDPLPG